MKKNVDNRAERLIQLHSLKPSDINTMREWVLDCAVDDDDEQDREEASDARIVVWTQRHFEGGITAFLETISG